MGTAYKLNGQFFSGRLGRVTPVARISVTDFTINIPSTIQSSVIISATPTPPSANYYKFHFSSSNPEILLVNDYTGEATPLGTGEVTIIVSEEYSGLIKTANVSVDSNILFSLTDEIFDGSRAITDLGFSLTEGEAFTILLDVTYNNKGMDNTTYFENIVCQNLEVSPYPGFVIRRGRARVSVNGVRTSLSIGSNYLYDASNNCISANSRDKVAYIFDPSATNIHTYFVNGGNPSVLNSLSNIASANAKLVIGAGYAQDNTTLQRYLIGTINKLIIYGQAMDSEYCQKWTQK